MQQTSALFNERKKIVQLPDSAIIAYKTSVTDYKNEADKASRPYGQKNLKRVYLNATGTLPRARVNFLIFNEYVLIVPESGEGLEKDMRNINEAKKLFSVKENL